MNEADRNLPQMTPNIQETAQTLFSEISQIIDAAKQSAAVAVIRNAELVRKPEDPIRYHLEQLRKEQQISPDLLLKDPYILDFLDISDRYLEKDLEDAILRDIEKFLLELGAGFTFIARQKRIQIDNDDFYIDLLFYNRKLKRLVAIDLKLGNFRHEYKSQMELYLRWLAKYDQESDEQSPLGIILWVVLKRKGCRKISR